MKKLPSGKTAKVNKDTKEMDGLGIAHNNWTAFATQIKSGCMTAIHLLLSPAS
jgi:hypothetical protein